MKNTDLAKADTTSQTAGGETAEVKQPESQAPATAEATADTAPETKTTSTEKTPEPVYRETGSPAVGAEGYYAELEAAKQRSAKKIEEEKKAKFESAREQDKIDSESPPAEAAATETPETPDTPVESVEPVATETEPAPEDTDTRTPDRIRLGGLKDGHLVAAANQIARAEGIPFADAWDRVAPKKEAPQQNEAATETATNGHRTRDEINAEIERVKAEKKQAAKDLDTAKMDESYDRLEELRGELTAIERSEQEAAAAEQRSVNDTIVKARAKAVQDWPEAGDENSEFSKGMNALADALEKDPDPELRAIVSEPDAPYVIAKMYAKQEGILPKHLRKEPSKGGTPNGTKPSTPAAAAKPAPVNQRAVGRPAQPAASPASGAARTTQGGSQAVSEVDKIRTATDYENFVARYKGNPVRV